MTNFEILPACLGRGLAEEEEMKKEKEKAERDAAADEEVARPASLSVDSTKHSR